MNLQAFHKENLFDATHRLFAQLGIRLNSNTKQSLSIRDVLNTHYKENPIFRAVEETYFSGVIDHSIFKQNANNSYQDAIKKADQIYEGLLLFSLKLNRYPTRTEIAELVRAFNRISQKMPVALLLCYSNSHDHYISLGLPERFKYLQDWRQGEKIGKVIILRDIHTQHPHAGHLRILNNLSIQGKNIQNFNDLHEHWLTILDLKILNKTFYNELANWFYWAMDKVEFPDDAEKNTEKRNAENLIRLITRFIFVWFMKEKKLVPQELFDKTYIDQLLNDKDKTHSTYYKAILQNLFFATLNTPMKKDDPKSRIFIDDAKKYGYKNDGYLQQGFYRYSRFIKDKEKFLKLFEQVPFLNGGLFDCLDTHDGKKEIRIDGFSDNPKNEERLKIPDELFFTEEELTVDLSNYLENGKNKTVTGLIPLLNKYIFTVAENTPIEEDVALDPELLGNVFENLLGAYLPESASTARKASGSYYTPKEIVSYMVDESLTSYFQTYFNRNDEPFLQNLRTLLSYDSNHNPFQDQPKLTEKFIEAIETVKILDPACGSGAFPMAILNKLTHLLHKLDPENKVWKKKLLEKIPPDIRSEAEKSFENKSLDYIRKLGLIENCIYGVDIQTIAIQISKLRFFLSLLIEQTIDDSKPNRDIRALPNLETKFVAANTLIALNSGSRGLAHTEKVEQLEEKLFTLREELFYANSRQEKLKLQKQEKETRERLKQALRTANFPPDTANKIADWDPFNQNQSADWFDPEWMFGIKDGFNIVIGNPPYLRIQGIRKANRKYADYLANHFKSATGAFDLYVLFVEKGLELLRQHGILNYIMPVKWTNAAFGKGLREIVSQKSAAFKIISFEAFQVFNSSTYTGLQWFKPNSPSLQYYQLDRDLPDNDALMQFLKQLQSEHFSIYKPNELSVDGWTLTDTRTEKILRKIREQPLKVKDVFERFFTGLQTSLDSVYFILNCTDNGRVIKGFSKQLNREVEIERAFVKPLLKGDQVHRYETLKTNNYVIFPYKLSNGKAVLYTEKEIRTLFPKGYAYLKENEFGRSQGIAYEGKPKLICPYLGFKSQFSSDLAGHFYGNTKCFGLIKRDVIPLHYHYLLGLLNSELLWFFLKNTGTIFRGGYFAFTPDYLNDFGFAQPDSKQTESRIVKLVENIMAKKAKGEDTTGLEREIDEMVYRLYGLSYEEVKVVDPEFWLSREEYEQVRLGGVGG
jgi:adenine-specific DNA-methyltransferase